MSPYFRALRIGLVGMALLAPLAGVIQARAQSVTPEETARSVRKMLQRLPVLRSLRLHRVPSRSRHGVSRPATAMGGTSKPTQRGPRRWPAASRKWRKEIEMLPTSQYDDRIRWATFYRILYR